jgi:hypothetical protein
MIDPRFFVGRNATPSRGRLQRNARSASIRDSFGIGLSALAGLCPAGRFDSGRALNAGRNDIGRTHFAMQQ